MKRTSPRSYRLGSVVRATFVAALLVLPSCGSSADSSAPGGGGTEGGLPDAAMGGPDATSPLDSGGTGIDGASSDASAPDAIAPDGGPDTGPPAGNPVYVSQPGAGTMDGSACANAHPVTWFNTKASWGSGAGQIGPDTVVHLCGTFTGAPNSTMLAVQGGGAANHPVTIYFEPGALLTAPYWSGNNNPGGGAIDASSGSYITIDGGSNGAIECSANGTGLAYQKGTLAVDMDACTHCEVKNLSIQNLFVHKGNACDVDQTLVAAIVFRAGASHVTVDHVTIHDVGWAISSNASYTTIGPAVEIYNIDHGFIVGAPDGVTVTNVVFHDNHVHDYAAWDTSADCYHHDGIHGFGGTTGVLQDLTIYNNLFDGTTGNNFNMHIFLEGTNDGTPWTSSPTSVSRIFNNVFSATSGGIGLAGAGAIGGGNTVYANNTLTGHDPSVVVACEAFGNTSNVAPGAVIENNAVQNCGVLVASTEPGPGQNVNLTVKSFDYNAYASCNHTYNCFFTKFNGKPIDVADFASWQTMSGYDGHSIADLASNTYFNLDATFHPQAGSPLIGKGDNLTSLCTGDLAPLCKDLAGHPRPTSGAWTIGAFE